MSKQKSFPFVKDLPKKEKQKKNPPQTKTVNGIKFDIYGSSRISCSCGSPEMSFVIIRDAKTNRFLGKRYICIEDSCLYRTAQQFQP